ncbi:Bacteriophage tail sheath protein [Desulfitobacterium hafniense]|uniref:Bacteriophage tail sheath protein n=1 Tax=Desulfitobacterium hafniense TaxID=49338 RepID=A0A098AXD9_DESHA|nr:phage tail sheath family protein [Desulfitobacterium hafniense]CDX01299.1 Bacteriophage tail sheath protein [Desulfitobacterium hafniense]
MPYEHGVKVGEVPTSVISPVQSTAGLQVVIGTAPINLAESTEYVNKPLLAYSYSEAVQALGFSEDWENYTLCEAMYAAFQLYGVSPVVLINVLDPTEHVTEVSAASVNILNGKALIDVTGILLDTLKVKLTAESESDLVKDTDYTATFDDEGKVIIAVIPGGGISAGQTALSVSYTKLDPSKVTTADIIGGVDVETGDSTGLELVNSVFPKFGFVPGIILAPKFSKDPTVEAVMKAKASAINTYFKAIAVVDVDSTEADNYTKIAEWKNDNNYTAANEVVCWPMVALGDKEFHLSTQLASLMSAVDSQYGDMPYKSPSNESLQINKAIVEDGKEVNLGPDQAAYLNGQGVVTALNFVGGWKAWGNRTGAYPASTDVKDTFIPVRRMHNWVANNIILTTWQKVDNPTNKRLIDTVVDSLNIWLNGLTTEGALLGGRVEFRSEENPLTDLLNGIVRFHVFLAEPTPAESIEFILEFDATYYNQLFAS